MMSDYDVTLVDDNTADMHVIFHGPKDSACRPLGQPGTMARRAAETSS